MYTVYYCVRLDLGQLELHFGEDEIDEITEEEIGPVAALIKKIFELPEIKEVMVLPPNCLAIGVEKVEELESLEEQLEEQLEEL